MKVVAIALLLALLGSLTGPAVMLAQEEGEPAADETSAPAEAVVVVGPDSGAPWWQWRMDPVPTSNALFAQIDYREFWARRIEALEHPSFDAELNLSSVMDGDALQREVEFLHDLQAKGQAQQVVVQHRIAIVYADDNESVIYDSYLDRSFLVDASTRVPITNPDVAPTVLNMAFRIQKMAVDRFPGLMFRKVVDSVRLADGGGEE